MDQPLNSMDRFINGFKDEAREAVELLLQMHMQVFELENIGELIKVNAR